MTDRSIPTLLLLLVLGAPAHAAAPASGEDALVAQCRDELAPRLFAGTAHGDAFVTAKDVQHQGDRIVVHLELASGEGRTIAGNCIFRDGKLFDVK